jgi:hypothetical protein
VEDHASLAVDLVLLDQTCDHVLEEVPVPVRGQEVDRAFEEEDLACHPFVPSYDVREVDQNVS